MAKTKFHTSYGPFACITGAGSGIGEAFAHALARRGLNLLLADVDEAALDRVSQTIGEEHSVAIELFVGDLSREDDVLALAERALLLEAGLLISNAGVASLGPFLDLSLDEQLKALDLHCRASLILAHRLGGAMRARGRGGIILLSSNSALLHTPLIANYAATKAYTLALAEALHMELKGEGVDVMALAPGMTETAALQRSGLDYGKARALIRRPSEIVEEALQALGKQPSYISSASDRLAALLLGRLLPRRIGLRISKAVVGYFYPAIEGPR
ncbi:MAG: SDR family NAD(P)-dependent oxidoreductase [Sandaracinaceae bacterium]|nr:SDR family NAD(P)-dependent oxidoreductase [Sandaracinaceae bacterium]